MESDVKKALQVRRILGDVRRMPTSRIQNPCEDISEIVSLNEVPMILLQLARDDKEAILFAVPSDLKQRGLELYNELTGPVRCKPDLFCCLLHLYLSARA